ncbi:MAG: malonyl-CoA decarboxylase family protein [Paracoccus sp. (in: a-proteobacteria)]
MSRPWPRSIFTRARARSGAPADPVARFHLGNGAAAWRVNWPADLAPGAVKNAHGLMINYLRPCRHRNPARGIRARRHRRDRRRWPRC